MNKRWIGCGLVAGTLLLAAPGWLAAAPAPRPGPCKQMQIALDDQVNSLHKNQDEALELCRQTYGKNADSCRDLKSQQKTALQQSRAFRSGALDRCNGGGPQFAFASSLLFDSGYNSYYNDRDQLYTPLEPIHRHRHHHHHHSEDARASASAGAQGNASQRHADRNDNSSSAASSRGSGSSASSGRGSGGGSFSSGGGYTAGSSNSGGGYSGGSSSSGRGSSGGSSSGGGFSGGPSNSGSSGAASAGASGAGAGRVK